MTDYWWYRGVGGNANWDSQSSPPNYDNWWFNSAHTTPATTLPGNGDKVYLDGTVAPATGPGSAKTFHTLVSTNLDADMTSGAIWSNVSIQTKLEWGRPDRRHDASFAEVWAGADCRVDGDANELVSVTSMHVNAVLALHGSLKFTANVIPYSTTMHDQAWIAGGEIKLGIFVFGDNTIASGIAAISFDPTSNPSIYVYGGLEFYKASFGFDLTEAMTIWMMTRSSKVRFYGAHAFGSGDRPTIKPPNYGGPAVMGVW